MSPKKTKIELKEIERVYCGWTFDVSKPDAFNQDLAPFWGDSFSFSWVFWNQSKMIT